MPVSHEKLFRPILALAACSLVLATSGLRTARAEETLAGLVDVRTNPSRWDPATQLDYFWVHLRNISGRNLYGHLWLVLSDVGPTPVTVANPSGTTEDGRPYFDITQLIGTDNIFAPGEELQAQITLLNPDHIRNKNLIQFHVDPRGNLVPLQVTANASPGAGYAPLDVGLSGRVIGVGTRYEWDFEGDGTFDYSSTTSPATHHRYATAATYHPVLRVTGPNNAISASTEVTAYQEPTSVTALAQPHDGVAALPVHLSATAIGRVSKYEWDFEGDGVYDYSNLTTADVDHTYSTPGTFHPTVRVTGGVVSLTASDSVVVRSPGPPDAPVLDAHATQTRDPSVAISGSCPGAISVEVSAPTGVFTVPVSGSRFTANVPLEANTVNPIVFTGSNALGRGASSATQVTNDQEPPSVAITFPAADATVFQDSTDVTGRVSDMLSGFSGLTVVVNGIHADVDVGIGTNGTFLARSVSISGSGPTQLTATATDALGNESVSQVSVSRGIVPPDAPSMVIVSGERQMARVMTMLPNPIVVRVRHPDGTPFGDKPVSFHVIRSNGELMATAAGSGGLLLQVRTDADGLARAYWMLGSDAGCGNNRVEVTSTDIVGTFVFCASATAAPAAQINVGSGNNQKTQSGAPTPEPLRAWVSDGCNGVANIPVQFTVVEGGGLVNGAPSVTVNTARTGHAEVSLMLGPNPGNNVVEATFPGGPGQVARFVATGIARDLTQPTRLEGLVLDNSSQPIGGAQCSVIIGGTTVATGATDVAGQFHFSGIPAGQAKLRVEGLPATHLNGAPIPAGSFPTLTFDILLVPNAANSLPTPVLLPPLNPHNARAYSTTHDVELTVEGVEGLKMIVHAGSMRLPDGSPAPDGTIIALNQVHHDDVPMPMPDGAAPPFAWTLQPGGSTFDPPVSIIYPNMSSLPPGSIAYFLSFNHGTNQFEIVAPGSVTEDGLSVITDAGTGIHVAGWGCNCPPYSVTGACQRCPDVCVDNGSISGGTVTVSDRYICFDRSSPQSATFTAQGATDSGGGKTVGCPGQETSVQIPPATIVYDYTVTRPPPLADVSGTGSSVTVQASAPGDYVCHFRASAARDCVPTPLGLPTATITVVKILHEVVLAARTNPDPQRSILGIGETVTFTTDPPTSATWSVSGAGTVSPTVGTRTTFEATLDPASPEVEATIGSSTCHFVFTTIVPTGIDNAVSADVGCGAPGPPNNTIGAETDFSQVMLPSTVSFGGARVMFRENIPGGAFTWPDGTADMSLQRVVNYTVSSANGLIDMSKLCGKPYSRLIPSGGTAPVAFRFEINVPEEYQNEGGGWVQWLGTENHPKEFRAGDGACRTIIEATNGRSGTGSWQGPWR